MSNAQPTLPLDRSWVAARIPHSDTMCLLDTVVTWDDVHICCSATSRRDTANPLRSHGQLVAVRGIEYAAQAVAAHGALCDAAQTHPRASFLASVRSIRAHVSRLDTIETPLDVEAKCTGGDDVNVLYRSTVHNGARILLAGHVAVALDASVA